MTPQDEAYCWGPNEKGQLGDGTTVQRLVPTRVLGRYRFRQVRAGYRFTCGVTTSDQAYCWGWNKYGQVGDSSQVGRRQRPVLVAGRHPFRQVSAGWYHACAVTTDDKAFCWGNGRSGALGNGRTYLSFWPRAVAARVGFERVSAGLYSSCGVTRDDRAFCWGWNYEGKLGDGTTVQRLKPVAVVRSPRFTGVTTAFTHTCGATADGLVYCWGDNVFGQLGDGTETGHPTPTQAGGLSPAIDGAVRDGSNAMDNSVVQVLHVSSFEDRGVIEFDISRFSGPVAQARLSLRVYGNNGPFPFTVAVSRYAGDGRLSAEDWEGEVRFASFTYAGETTVTLDVTEPVGKLVSAGATFAGFNFSIPVSSSITVNGPFVAFNSLEYGPAATLEVTEQSSP